ncbi:MAG: hypothetical protein K0R98_1163 [Rickettsiaceae bacterium]|jgi:hypothetical protein|nr:hypothetical protein [Rickettsiaceae bacterium]
MPTLLQNLANNFRAFNDRKNFSKEQKEYLDGRSKQTAATEDYSRNMISGGGYTAALAFRLKNAKGKSLETVMRELHSNIFVSPKPGALPKIADWPVNDLIENRLDKVDKKEKALLKEMLVEGVTNLFHNAFREALAKRRYPKDDYEELKQYALGYQKDNKKNSEHRGLIGLKGEKLVAYYLEHEVFGKVLGHLKGSGGILEGIQNPNNLFADYFNISFFNEEIQNKKDKHTAIIKVLEGVSKEDKEEIENNPFLKRLNLMQKEMGNELLAAILEKYPFALATPKNFNDVFDLIKSKSQIFDKGEDPKDYKDKIENITQDQARAIIANSEVKELLKKLQEDNSKKIELCKEHFPVKAKKRGSLASRDTDSESELESSGDSSSSSRSSSSTSEEIPAPVAINLESIPIPIAISTGSRSSKPNVTALRESLDGLQGEITKNATSRTPAQVRKIGNQIDEIVATAKEANLAYVQCKDPEAIKDAQDFLTEKEKTNKVTIIVWDHPTEKGEKSRLFYKVQPDGSFEVFGADKDAKAIILHKPVAGENAKIEVLSEGKAQDYSKLDDKAKDKMLSGVETKWQDAVSNRSSSGYYKG